MKSIALRRNKNKWLTLACAGLSPVWASGSTGAVGQKPSQERPNILWLTFEDTSDYEFGCYDNPHARTPVVDSLASSGIRFVNAYSNGPQSSPARSTIITGCYSTTFAMDWHRQRVNTPEGILFPQYLRDAGYFCTNMNKTDYNTTIDNKSCWDECGNKRATYNNPSRGEGQPFFAVFNSGITHMSRLTSYHTDGRRDFGLEGLDPGSLMLPPHVPDIEEVRSDYAFHLEGAGDIDRWVEIFLKDLKKNGLDDNTIIFVFSDHGGCLPRGKAFGYESSFRVPMVVHVPEKWRHLCSIAQGEPSDRMVAFADLAPTVLSLAGVRPPDHMQGIAFMGPYEGEARRHQHGLVCNREFHYTPSRSVSDGKWKYIRNYIPYKPDALFNSFQWQMPSNMGWDRSYFEGECITEACVRPYNYKQPEELYDLGNDPFELNNLAGDTAHSGRLARMRELVCEHIRSTGDLGLFPLSPRTGDEPLYDIVKGGYDLESLFRLAELTATVTIKDIPELEAAARSPLTATRFWAAVNYAVLATRGGIPASSPYLVELGNDPDPGVAQEACYALFHTDARDVAAKVVQEREMFTTLEMLSLDESMREYVLDNFGPMLRSVAGVYDDDSVESVPRMATVARKVLVNTGEIKADRLFGNMSPGRTRYEKGLEINRNRRPLTPRPEYRE